jgi:hypothetical protein
MKTNHYAHFLLAITLLVSSGCAFNRTLSYQRVDTRIAPPQDPALIAFHDQREYVLSGKEKTTFCGHVNSSAQIAYNVQTKDGLPLSTELAKAVSASMNDDGGKTTYLTTDPHWNQDSLVALIKSKAIARTLLFTLTEWEVSALPLFSTIRYEVRYDMALSVYDNKGELLVSTTTYGSRRKEEGVAVSMKKMQAYSLDILQDVVHELLTKEPVRQVIAGR